jgi:hypothetical protein
MSEMRQFRTIAYRLKEVEDAMRAGRLIEQADDLARALRLFGPSPVSDFLEESRQVLVNLLLGDRELPCDMMGEVLDAIAEIDKSLLELRKP